MSRRLKNARNRALIRATMATVVIFFFVLSGREKDWFFLLIWTALLILYFAEYVPRLP